MLQTSSDGVRPQQWTDSSNQTPITPRSAGPGTIPPGQREWFMPGVSSRQGVPITRKQFGIPASGSVWKEVAGSLSQENAMLVQAIDALERELEAIQTSFANQELRVLEGYLISVRPGIGVPFAAWCPKLRAVAQGDSMEDALADLRDAMGLFLTYKTESGQAVPPKDVEG